MSGHGDPGLGKLQLLIQQGIIAMAEEIGEPALAAAFLQADVSIDVGLSAGVEIRAVLGRSTIYNHYVGIGVERNSSGRLQPVKLAAQTLSVIRSNLSILSSMKYVKLKAKFPDHLREVNVEMNDETKAKLFKVVFQNGHILNATEPEIDTDDFYAKCLMVYDLPNL